jgi:cleavage stimulation factor subunit 3
METEIPGIQPSLPPLPEKLLKWKHKIDKDIWDSESWSNLFVDLQQGFSSQLFTVDVCRQIYECFLFYFPTAGRYWKHYLEMELQLKNFSRVDDILSKCLVSTPHIDLWKSYISYVQIKHANDFQQIVDSFEFTLKHMGMDPSCTQIWTDYIAFASGMKTSNTKEEIQKMTTIRKLYQRAIETPMHNLEQVWKEYDKFENETDKILAKPILSEYGPRYMAARTTFKERKRYWESLIRNMLPAIPGLPFQGNGATYLQQQEQLSLWKKVIEYEKGNPQKYEKVDNLHKRIAFTYEQCLLCFYRFPEVWYEYVQWSVDALQSAATTLPATANTNNNITLTTTNSNQLISFETVWELFERALKAVPDCLALYFYYADCLEIFEKNTEKGKQIFEQLLVQLGAGTSSSSSSSNNSSSSAVPPEEGGVTTEQPNTSSGNNSSAVSAHHQGGNVTEKAALVYIAYMRWSRRALGLKESRNIFRRARNVNHHLIYVAAATVEWQLNRDVEVARKVFDLGMRKYGTNTLFVREYLQFQLQLNEENNTRVLFERAVSMVPKDRAKELWDMYLQFEFQHGDAASIARLEKRRASIYPHYSASRFFSLLQQHKFGDLWPCSSQVLQTTDVELWGQRCLPSVFASSNNDSAAADSDNNDENNNNNNTNNPMSSLNNESHSRFPRPDTSAMISFKPDIPSSTVMGLMGSLPISGGSTVGSNSATINGTNISTNNISGPNNNITNTNTNNTIPPESAGGIPEFLATFILNLPPPSNWTGPLLDVDQLIQVTVASILPNLTELNNCFMASVPLAVLLSSVNSTTALPTTPAMVPPLSSTVVAPSVSHTRKRKNDEDDDEEESVPSVAVNIPASKDIFRQRQAAKLSKKM